MQIAKIVRRITKKRAGLKEEETLRCMQALVVSRRAYSLPFHSLNKQEEEQANVILRTACKAALGLPNYTASEKLMSLGLSNTFDEIREATILSQKRNTTKNENWQSDPTKSRLHGRCTINLRKRRPQQSRKREIESPSSL